MPGEPPKNPQNLNCLKIHPANALPIQEINYGRTRVISANIIDLEKENPLSIKL
jgi:hypothetical protein